MTLAQWCGTIFCLACPMILVVVAAWREWKDESA